MSDIVQFGPRRRSPTCAGSACCGSGRSSSTVACNTRPSMEGRAQVNGVELWYQVTGEGEPVIQIHGAGFGHFNFAPATPVLSERFKVIDYDMRGYGQSDRPVQDYDMEVWADDV